MGVTAAFREGLRRVNGAPAVLAGLFALTLAVGLPLAYLVETQLAARLGSSLAGETAASAADPHWWREFRAQASGLGRTFAPSIAGFGAVLDNLEGLADNLPLASGLAVVTAGWLLVWSFLSGGVLDRLARGRRTGSHGFFGACGMHVWRLLRLGLLAWGAYGLLFGYVHGWIFTGAVGRLGRAAGTEQAAFALRAGGYLLFGALILACNILFDYARIRLVVEDRRSATGALLAGLRFVRRHPGAVSGLYGVNAVAFLLLVALYAASAPAFPAGGRGALVAFACGELYILARLYLKLQFYGSQTALFQGALAHAAYTAAPAVVWPDSPDAESIANADRASL